MNDQNSKDDQPPLSALAREWEERAAATGLVSIHARLTYKQREKLARLGGTAWLRQMLDHAVIPEVSSPGGALTRRSKQ